jgi:hypothetical protein
MNMAIVTFPSFTSTSDYDVYGAPEAYIGTGICESCEYRDSCTKTPENQTYCKEWEIEISEAKKRIELRQQERSTINFLLSNPEFLEV